MKHIIWLLSLFLLSNSSFLLSQATSTVVLTTKGPSKFQTISTLPILNSPIESDAILPLPIYKLPESFEKKYIIRVHQSDTAIFQKFTRDFTVGLHYHRGFDHKGYDYFLPVAFNKEEQAASYLSQLKGSIFGQAIIVKNTPKNVKCNCFSRF